jgi:hypothetical protein
MTILDFVATIIICLLSLGIIKFIAGLIRPERYRDRMDAITMNQLRIDAYQAKRAANFIASALDRCTGTGSDAAKDAPTIIRTIQEANAANARLLAGLTELATPAKGKSNVQIELLGAL